MIGSDVRMVWARAWTKVVFFDTADRKGEVERGFEGVSRINRPIITPSGRQVVFICFDQWASYIVNWDGTGLRKLVEGRVTCVQVDEKGVERYYYQNKQNEFRVASLTEPGPGEVVLKLPTPPRENKTENFQVSADGKCAGAGKPWPDVGFARLPQKDGKDFIKVGSGCWSQMARDNSYRMFWCTDGSHTRIQMYDGNTAKNWRMPFNPRGRGGAECPRWANDTRFLICTDRGGKNRNVYLGQFNNDFTALSTWLVVSSLGENGEADVWVAAAAKYPGAAAPVALPTPPTTPSVASQTPPVKAETPAKVEQPAKAEPVAPEEALPPWPATHKDLMFLWAGMGADNWMLGPDGTRRAECKSVLRGEARPGRYKAANLTRGSLVAQVGGREFAPSCAQSNQFTLALVLNAAGARPTSPGAIMCLGADAKNHNLMLEQSGDQLALSIGVPGTDGKLSGQTATLGRLKAGETQHIAVTHVAGAPGKTTVYVNGRPTLAAATISGSLRGWQEQPLVFGDLPNGGRNWAGIIEGAALYCRALSAAEIKADCQAFAARLAKRKPLEQYEVRAKLLQAAPTPNPRDLRDYSRYVAPYEYLVEQVIKGAPAAVSAGKKIVVYHWVILDSRPVAMNRQLGQSYQLAIEKWEDWPHMAQEGRAPGLEELDAPEFIDVGGM